MGYFSAKQVFLSIPMIIFIGMLFACVNDINEVNELTSKNILPLETAQNVEVIYSDSGQAKMQLNAPRLDRYSGDKSYVEFFEGVKVVFFDSLMHVQSQLTANYAVHREAENIMEAKKDVVVINEKGEKLNTEHLIWNKATELIYTEEFVKITTAEEVIMGEGMEADQHFTKYKIKKIKGTISINNDDENN